MWRFVGILAAGSFAIIVFFIFVAAFAVLAVFVFPAIPLVAGTIPLAAFAFFIAVLAFLTLFAFFTLLAFFPGHFAGLDLRHRLTGFLFLLLQEFLQALEIGNG